MTVSTQKGAIGWVGQYDQDDFVTGSDWVDNGETWHRFIAGEFDIAQMQQEYAYEVGGDFLSPGMYKSAYWSGGRLSVIPRLAVTDNGASGVTNGLIPLFWSYAGTMVGLNGTAAITTATLSTAKMGSAAATMANLGPASGDRVLVFPGAEPTGGTDAQFGWDQGDGDDKWLTIRRVLPEDGGDYVGETFYNSKVSGMTLTAAAGAPLRLDFDFVGGAGDSDSYDQVVLEAFTGTPVASDGWNFATARDTSTVPLATRGFVKEGAMIQSESKKHQDLQISFGSSMTPPQQMLVIGQYCPIDLSVLARPIGISYTYLWNNANLYRQLRYGGTSGTTFSPTVYSSGFWSKFQEGGGVYSLGFFAQNVQWVSRPVGLAGRNIVRMRMDGVVTTTTGAKWGLWLSAPGLTGAETWPAS